MAFWSGEKLSARGPSIFTPYVQAQIDCNAYVLRMGDKCYATAEQEASGEHPKRVILSSKEAFVIPAGQFAFLLSKENVSVPQNAMAFISMRTPFKFRGLINVSGFHVDPGYNGQLVYAVFNASPLPIQIKEHDLAFKIWLCDLDHNAAPENSGAPYVASPTGGLHDISNEMMHGMSREILSLQSLAQKLREQDLKLETRFAEHKPLIDNLSFIWRALQLAVIGAVLITVLTFSLPLAYHAAQDLITLSHHAAPAPATPAPALPAPAAPKPPTPP